MIRGKSQQSGDNSVNIQAKNVNISEGLSISHVREIAIEVFEKNFYRLAGKAKELASERASIFTSQLLEGMVGVYPEGIAMAEDPDFQYSLFEAQKSYARSGDQKLADVLVQMLIELTKLKSRNLEQISRAEAIGVVPKLTQEHLDIIDCIYQLKYCQKTDLETSEDLFEYLVKEIIVFQDSIVQSDHFYSHLSYVGCVTFDTLGSSLIGLVKRNCSDFFYQGFRRDLANQFLAEYSHLDCWIVPHKHKPNMWQVDQEQVWEPVMAENGGDLTREALEFAQELKLFDVMKDDDAEDWLTDFVPDITEFLYVTGNTSFGSISLTSVGIAVAEAIVKANEHS